jgi:WD40 repeat protein
VDIWASIDSGAVKIGTLVRKIEGYPEPIAALAWSSDGEKLAAASWEDNLVTIWDPMTGDRLDTLAGHLDNISSLVWSPDGELLASGDADGLIILWDPVKGDQIRTLEGHDEVLAALAWSPNGDFLASSSYDETMIIWDVEVGEPVHSFNDFYYPISCLGWSPDGTHIAGGSLDETITIWDVQTGKEGIVYKDHLSFVTGLDWSPDGTRIASGAMGLGQVLVWDAVTGETLYTLEAHGGPVTAVAWSPDGSMLASSSMDGTVILWDAALLEIPPEPTSTPGPSPTPTLEPHSMGPFHPVVPAEVDFLGDAWSTDLYAAPGGELYLYTDRAIALLSGSTWEPYLSDLPGDLLGFDESDRVWVASEDGSQISAWDGHSWKSYGPTQGWAPFTTQNWWYRPVQQGVHIDSSGQVWVGTFEDIRVFDGARWTVYSLEELGMPSPEYEEANFNFTFASTNDGSQLWVGACDTSPLGPSKRGGLSWFDGNNWHGAGAGIPQGCAGSIQEDADGRVWVGINGDVWLFDPVSGSWKSFTPPAPLPPLEALWYGRVTDISLDPHGNPWVTFLLCGGAGCEGLQLLHHLEDGVWTQITESSFQMEGLQQLLLDGAGTPWLFWNGTIYQMSGNLPQPVASLVARRVVLDVDGQPWFTAWYEGQDWLWTLETE